MYIYLDSYICTCFERVGVFLNVFIHWLNRLKFSKINLFIRVFPILRVRATQSKQIFNFKCSSACEHVYIGNKIHLGKIILKKYKHYNAI